MWFVYFLIVLVLTINTDASKHKRPSVKTTRPIVGGDKASIKNFPYQVSITHFKEDKEGVRNTSHFCGGSIISVEWVLTAAHCVNEENPQDILVRVGSSVRDEGGHVHDVSRIVIHDDYESDDNDHDIALLKIAQPFEFGPNVRPIKLNKKMAPPGRIAIVTGWGHTVEDGELAKNLKKVQVPIIAQWECKWSYGSDEITDNMFCAGRSGLDSCQGDSGGPIVSHDRQIGVVSWGEGCARPGFPGVYTNIQKFRSWIRKKSGV